ncbi:unnamed protein product [Choristocarpus tenellus]
MTSSDLCDIIWRELVRLRDDVVRPGKDGIYEDMAAYEACRAVAKALEATANMPRHDFLSIFERLAEPIRLDNIFRAIVDSEEHPALQNACYMVLTGVVEVECVHETLMGRQDVMRSILAVLASPRKRRISPASWIYNVTPASAATTSLTGLCSSCGTLKPAYAKSWIKLGALRALASAIDGQAGFDDSDVITETIPQCFFVMGAAFLAGAGEAAPVGDKILLGKAWLTLFADRPEWVNPLAHDHLADLFRRPNWLTDVVHQIPVIVRKRAVATATAYKRNREGAWTAKGVHELATVLGSHGDGNKSNMSEGLGSGDANTKFCSRKCSWSMCDMRPNTSVPRLGQEEEQGMTVPLFKCCSRCKVVIYCSRDCQRAHWKAGHKWTCRPPMQ